MKKLTKTLLALLMATVFAASGCSGSGDVAVKQDVVLMTENSEYKISEKTTPVEYYATSYDVLGGKDVMPIGGYHGPYKSGGSVNGMSYPNMMDEEYIEMLSEAGINMICYMATRVENYYSGIEEMLKLGEKYGMGFFLNLLYIEQIIGGRSPSPITDLNESELYDRLVEASYGFKYKSLLGFHLLDELFPTNQLKNAIIVKNAIDSFGLPIDIYSNAHAYYESKSFSWFGLANATYAEYMAEFRKLNLSAYSCTGYPWDSASGTEDSITDATVASLMTMLTYSRKTALENKQPYWRMLQAGHQWQSYVDSEPYAPLEGEFVFDANMALAFGAKGLQYYTCVALPSEQLLPDGTYDSQRNGLIGTNGKKTQWWHYLKKVTKQVEAIDHVLMNSANIGIIAHGEYAQTLCKGIKDNELLLGDSFRQLKEISGSPAFIGCFDYQGGTALYVVNASRNNRATVGLSFDDNYGYDVVQRGESVSVVGKTMQLVLDPGEGTLVVIR